MTTLIAKLDNTLLKIPQLDKYLGKDVMITINDIIDEIRIENYKSDSQEILWLNSISKNPAFDFLKDEAEDIYTLNDGKELNA